MVTKTILQIVLGMCIALSSFGADVKYQINGNSIIYLYEAHAGKKTSTHELAKMISSKYMREKNEFIRQDLLKELTLEINQEIVSAKNSPTVTMSVKGKIDRYNFDKSGFYTGLKTSTYIPFGNNYTVDFENIASFAFMPVHVEEAKKLPINWKTREVTYLFTGEITNAEIDMNSRSRNNSVVMKISSLSLVSKNGDIFLTINAPAIKSSIANN